MTDQQFHADAMEAGLKGPADVFSDHYVSRLKKFASLVEKRERVMSYQNGFNACRKIVDSVLSSELEELSAGPYPINEVDRQCLLRVASIAERCEAAELKYCESGTMPASNTDS